MTYAKVIADSVSASGHRLTTMEVRLHRFVLAELNTHRVFSRNSASSRAIPVAKQLDRIREDLAYPVSWPAEQKGMQGEDELPEDLVELAAGVWRDAAQSACYDAAYLHSKGLHKSVTNRILEPFMWHTVVVTATDWDGFFAQRLDKAAQPEFRAAAECMRNALSMSSPQKVLDDQWHVPYLQQDEIDELDLDLAIKISAARCARVSYLQQDGTRDHDRDLDLYERLTAGWHLSPLEHVAIPNDRNVHIVKVPSTVSGRVKHLKLPMYGNVLGWHSLRYTHEVESEDRQTFK